MKLNIRQKKAHKIFAGQLKYQVDRRKSFSKREFHEACQREKITNYLKSIISKVIWLMMSLWGIVCHHCVNSENKSILATTHLTDKLIKIHLHIRKTNVSFWWFEYH